MEEVKRAIKKIVDKTALEGILYEKVDNATTDWRVECIASAVGYLTKATFELRVFALISAPEPVIAGRRYGIDVDQPVHLLISEMATAILRTGYVPLSEVDDDTDTFIPLDASIN